MLLWEQGSGVHHDHRAHQVRRETNRVAVSAVHVFHRAVEGFVDGMYDTPHQILI